MAGPHESPKAPPGRLLIWRASCVVKVGIVVGRMDHSQIEALYERLGGILFRRCAALLGDLDDARDATQDAFVRLLRHADELDDPASALPWMYRVSTNVCLDRLRRRARLRYAAPEDLPDVADPLGAEERLVLRDQLRAVMAALDERAQRVFVHLAFDGMTQEEVGAVLGLSRRTVNKIAGRLREVVDATGA